MEIPLKLRERKGGALVASLPPIFRLSVSSVLAILVASLAVSGGAPGPLGWIILALIALAALYEDRWTFDPAAREAIHRVGTLPLAKRTVIGFDRLVRVRLEPFVRGTVPGSSEEATENAAALLGGRIGGPGKRGFSSKRHYLCIVLEAKDGARWFVDAGAARKIEALRARAARVAEACGVPMEEG
jgi:hypothetical protein